MKNLKALLVAFISLFFLSSVYAGDKEDVRTLVDNAIEALNQHNVPTYFSYFTDDNTEFSYVVTPLRHNASSWKAFIQGTTKLAYVSYQGQDNEIQIYNGDAAVVTGYYTFSWMEKGGQMNYQSGRATIVAVKKEGKWLIAHMHFSEMF